MAGVREKKLWEGRMGEGRRSSIDGKGARASRKKRTKVGEAE